MKICLFSHHVYPMFADNNASFGGAERNIGNLAIALAKNPDNDVYLVTKANDLERSTVIKGVTIIPLFYNETPRNRYAARLAFAMFQIRILWALVRIQANVYYVSQAAVETVTVQRAARLMRQPIVYRMASTMELDHAILRDCLFFGRERLARMFENCLPKMSAIVAQTPEQAALLYQRFGLSATVISNMLNITSSEQNEPQSPRKSTVLWVGRAHPMKHPEDFLELANHLPQLDFVGVMSPTGGNDVFLNSIMEKAKTIPNLQLIPGLPPNDMPNAYQSAQIFVMTSESEGFPNVMAEAMAYGAIPVLTRLNPAGWLSPDYTKPACGYYCNDNLQTAVKTIQCLSQDQILRDQCIQLAKNKVRSTMMPENVVDHHMQLFLKLTQ